MYLIYITGLDDLMLSKINHTVSHKTETYATLSVTLLCVNEFIFPFNNIYSFEKALYYKVTKFQTVTIYIF
jgi:hypothetical protein